MVEILQKLAMKCGGLREPGMRGDGIWVFTEPDLQRLIDHLTNEKDKEIDQLKSQLFTAKAQNDIYRGAMHDR
jgi:hypothetical protein